MCRSVIVVRQLSVVLFALTATIAVAQYQIDWHTIDGGGQLNSTGATYELSGTIGQPDAGPSMGPMIGGTYELAGGFWMVSQVCYCPGDMNSDGRKDALDVQNFVACFTAGGTCTCADTDLAGGVSLDDVPVFVEDLLNEGVCPQ